MKLPNLEAATIQREKIAEYLVSLSHTKGRDKAGFFRRHGFLPETWELLAAALRAHAAAHGIARIDDAPFGTSYVVEGQLQTPDGRNPYVRAIWFVDRGYETPRFINAYPLRRRIQ